MLVFSPLFFAKGKQNPPRFSIRPAPLPRRLKQDQSFLEGRERFPSGKRTSLLVMKKREKSLSSPSRHLSLFPPLSKDIAGSKKSGPPPPPSPAAMQKLVPPPPPFATGPLYVPPSFFPVHSERTNERFSCSSARKNLSSLPFLSHMRHW